MTTNRHILVLHDDDKQPDIVTALADSITRLGSTAVVLSMHDGNYERILDAVAIADTVLCWPSD
jgi:hypothetical protein